MSDIEWEIREMLRQGRTYREIAEALNVSFTTIRKVKKKLELEEATLKLLNRLKQTLSQKDELKRAERELRRYEALPTEEKLVSLWMLWSEWEEDVRFSMLLDNLSKLSVQGFELWMFSYLRTFNDLFNIFATFVTLATYIQGGLRGYPPLLVRGYRVT